MNIIELEEILEIMDMIITPPVKCKICQTRLNSSEGVVNHFREEHPEAYRDMMRSGMTSYWKKIWLRQ